MSQAEAAPAYARRDPNGSISVTGYAYDGYRPLIDVLVRALDQAAIGKGRERHANDLPFLQQPMQMHCDALKTNAGLVYQVCKKMGEAQSMDPEKAVHEMLGAIVYAAGAILWLERHRPATKEPSLDKAYVAKNARPEIDFDPYQRAADAIARGALHGSQKSP